MNTPHDFSLQSTEAHAALDVVADAEVRAKAPGKTGFAPMPWRLMALSARKRRWVRRRQARTSPRRNEGSTWMR